MPCALKRSSFDRSQTRSCISTSSPYGAQMKSRPEDKWISHLTIETVVTDDNSMQQDSPPEDEIDPTQLQWHVDCEQLDANDQARS
jgi:hypothetical protein